MRVGVSVGFTGPISLPNFAKDELSEFDTLLFLDSDQKVSGFTPNLGFIAEEHR